MINNMKHRNSKLNKVNENWKSAFNLSNGEHKFELSAPSILLAKQLNSMSKESDFTSWMSNKTIKSALQSGRI